MGLDEGLTQRVGLVGPASCSWAAATELWAAFSWCPWGGGRHRADTTPGQPPPLPQRARLLSPGLLRLSPPRTRPPQECSCSAPPPRSPSPQPLPQPPALPAVVQVPICWPWPHLLRPAGVQGSGGHWDNPPYQAPRRGRPPHPQHAQAPPLQHTGRIHGPTGFPPRLAAGAAEATLGPHAVCRRGWRVCSRAGMSVSQGITPAWS